MRTTENDHVAHNSSGCQITREITFKKAANSNRQKPPRKRRTIQIRPSALASKDTARAPNHIRSAILRIMGADYTLGSDGERLFVHLPGLAAVQAGPALAG